MNKISPSLENYLETIYECIQNNGEARVTDIAEQIGISKPSVNQAMIALKKKGLIKYKKYEPLELTPEGKKKAAQIRKRHHVFERFLTQVLKVPHEIAKQDACKMEHILSETTFEKFMQFLDEY